jgi:serine/threonine protein kinase
MPSGGSDGRVHLHDNHENGEQICLKDPWLDTAFSGEIEALIRLDHPCVMAIFGILIIMEGTQPQIVTEYPCNSSLHRFFTEKGTTSMGTANQMKITVRTVRGMRFMHRDAVVHQDLEPAIILLDHMFELTICDFRRSKQVVNKL